MDDFLHNLRSGKNKNAERGRRNFDNPTFKGGDRQGGRDKNRGNNGAVVPTPEYISALTVTLKDIAESFSRMAEAYEDQARSATRHAQCMEQILEHIRSNPQPARIPMARAAIECGTAELTPVRLKEQQKIELKARIEALSAEGLSYKKIATQFQTEGLPTLSGKGSWHGRSVSRIVNGE